VGTLKSRCGRGVWGCLRLHGRGVWGRLRLHFRRPQVVVLEEGNGERILVTSIAAKAHVQIAGLDHSAIGAVIPWGVLFKKDAEFSPLKPHLRLSKGETDQFQLVDRCKQVRALIGIQHHESSLARAHGAERAHTGAPDGAAAGLEGMIDSLIGLGFLGDLDGLYGLDGLHGLDGLLVAWVGFLSPPYLFQFVSST